MQSMVRGVSDRQQWQTRFLEVTLIVMVIALLRIGVVRVREAQAQSERETLEAISRILQLPSTTKKYELYARLQDYASDRNAARKDRIARMVGLDVSWDHLFACIERMDISRRTRIIQAISQEYGLSQNLPWPQMKRIVSANRLMRTQAFVHPHFLIAE